MKCKRGDVAGRGSYLVFGKRLCDIVLASLLLITLLIPLAVMWLIIRLNMGPPVMFRQTRLGRQEKPFDILKFRTMTDDRDSRGNRLAAERRLTRLGTLLRKTSLDELPQLWNVLRGDMSIVGPRPLHPYYLPYYRQRERRRHEVRPGMTGLAQIRGGKLLDWDSRLNLDVQYVEQVSLALDMRIIAATAILLLAHRNGATAPSSKFPTLAEHRGFDVLEDSNPVNPPATRD